jgi:6-phosphogluconolactonase
VSSRFVILPTPADVAQAAADRIVAAARNAIGRRGRCVLALSGGSTPRLVYPLLCASPRAGLVEWARVVVFWGDERAVPPDHPDSNYGLARTLLLDHLPGLRPTAVHRMPADAPDRDLAATGYEAEIRRVLAPRPASPSGARFDLIWLGMGPDGHTASLFPGADELDERRRWIVPATAPKTAPVRDRMTFTLPIINAARAVLFVVTGADKAPAVHSIRAGSRDLPAGRVRAGSTLWLLDAAAGWGAPR